MANKPKKPKQESAERAVINIINKKRGSVSIKRFGQFTTLTGQSGLLFITLHEKAGEVIENLTKGCIKPSVMRRESWLASGLR